MEKKRKVSYGVINWAELVRECLFADNTRYIRELEAIKTPVRSFAFMYATCNLAAGCV